MDWDAEIEKLKDYKLKLIYLYLIILSLLENQNLQQII